jgi:hypothetical protein
MGSNEDIPLLSVVQKKSFKLEKLFSLTHFIIHNNHIFGQISISNNIRLYIASKEDEIETENLLKTGLTIPDEPPFVKIP